MKRTSLFQTIGAAIVVVALMMTTLSSNAFAAGTLAGTAISNQASVGYNAGSNARTATSNLTTLHVAHKVVASYAPASGSSNGVDDVAITVPIQLVNSGNRWDVFNVSVAKGGANTSSYTVTVLDSVSVGTLSNTNWIKQDGYRNFNLRIVAGSGIPDNDVLTVTVTMTSTAANNGVDTVMANAGAAFIYVYTYTVHRPNLVFSVTRPVAITNANSIPGTSQTYLVSVQNTGSAAPTSNAQIIWQYSTTDYPFASSTGTAGTDTVAAGWKEFVLTPAQLPATMGIPITFNVVFAVDQTQNGLTGPSNTTTIYVNDPANAAKIYIKYGHGAISKWFNASVGTLNFTVGTASGASWAAPPANSSGNPGDSIQYAFTLKNTGNHADNYTFSNVQNAGNYDQAHQFFTALPGAALAQLAAPLAAGATQALIIRCPIPVGATNAQTVGRNIIATTQTVTNLVAPTGGSTAASYTAPLITTVNAPILVVTIADSLVSGSGTAANPAPTDVIQWKVTIKNNGSGNATSVSSSNTGFAHTGSNTYNPGTIIIDPGTGVWGAVADNGSFVGPSSGSVSVSSGVITITFNPIASGGGQVQYRYRVTVQ